MDWARARLLLLLTFTLVNLALLDRVWRPGGAGLAADVGVAAFELREARTRLSQQGFDLTGPVPPSGKMLPFLRLAAPTPATRQRVAAWFGGLRSGAPVPSPTLPIADTEEVLALESGAVVFRPHVPRGPEVRLSNRKEVRQIADQFLEKAHLTELAELRWSRTVALASGRVRVEYSQVHGGYPVYAGYVHVLVGRGGIEEAVAFLPEIREFRGEPKGVLSGTQALLRLAGQLSVGGGAAGGGAAGARRSLTDLELGYYAPYPGPGAPAWEVVPVWRVSVDGREAYYVNALTGEFEAS